MYLSIHSYIYQDSKERYFGRHYPWQYCRENPGLYKERLEELKERISIIESALEKMVLLGTSKDTLNDLSFFELAKDIYYFVWHAGNIPSITMDMIKEDEELKGFLEAFFGEKIDKLNICFYNDIKWEVYYNNYTFSPKKRYIVGMLFDKRGYEKYVDNNDNSGFHLTAKDLYCGSVVENILMPTIYYKGYFNNTILNKINFDSSWVQEVILRGGVCPLAKPDWYPFPLKYSIIIDLSCNSFNCIYTWLSETAKQPDNQLSEYEKKVLKALNSYLIPVLRKKINKRINEDMKLLADLLKHLENEYETHLEFYTGIVTEEIKRLKLK